MKIRRILIALLFSASVVLLSACNRDDIDGPGYRHWNGDFYVKYFVDGTTSSVNITIENETGGISQFSKVDVPWDYEFVANAGTGTYDYLFVYLSAQNQVASGSVVTTIYYKKFKEDEYEQYKTSTSVGAYVIASVSGSLKSNP